ncbi:MAG: hypothetical protein ISF22_06510 [Methanomassiliicoccus sp.]|nr:hypothetical protein [Methanomassiliicoccus sp.]
MIGARECVGSSNCLERSAPSYHCRAVAGEHTPHRGLRLEVDLRRLDLGTPLVLWRR